MTERELKFVRCKWDVKEQESRVKEAKAALDQGYKKLQAEMEQEYSKLKCEYERELIKLEKEKAYLKAAEEDMEAGYSKSDS